MGWPPLPFLEFRGMMPLLTNSHSPPFTPMKVTFRIREEITSENGQKISRFYCEKKFFWLWWDIIFRSEDVDDEDEYNVTQVYFNTKQEALTALRERYQTPELNYYEVGSP